MEAMAVILGCALGTNLIVGAFIPDFNFNVYIQYQAGLGTILTILSLILLCYFTVGLSKNSAR